MIFFAMIKKESVVDMYIRLKEKSSRMDGTVQDEMNKMIHRYYTPRTVAVVKRQIGHYQEANPMISGVGKIAENYITSHLRMQLRDQHLWLVNRMGYSYILIGVQDLQCSDITCEELIDGNDLHELGKAFVVNEELHAKSGCTIPLEDHPPGSHYEDNTSFIEFRQNIT